LEIGTGSHIMLTTEDCEKTKEFVANGVNKAYIKMLEREGQMRPLSLIIAIPFIYNGLKGVIISRAL
jgi:hypothetical protein